jgi:DNA repair protein RadC
LLFVKLSGGIVNILDITTRGLKPAEAEHIIRLAKAILHSKFRKRHRITTPADTKDYLFVELAGEKNEIFCVLFLDNRHGILSFDRMFYGSVDGASIYTRVVVERAIALNAAVVIFVHNHPSGIAEPSNADHSITKRLTEALALIADLSVFPKNQSHFWTLSYFMGLSPTSITNRLPIGVCAPKLVSLRQRYSCAERRLAC